MKPFLLISIFAISLSFSSCEPKVKESPEYRDSVSEVEKELANQKALTTISTEHLFRFFSSNFHVTGNLPCMYYDPTSDEYVISGKKLFTKIKAENRKGAMDSFHEFLCVRGYSPDGDEAQEEFQKVKVDGKDMYVAQMSDLLPEMLPEEKALFTGEQIQAMRQTSPSYAYHFLGTDRDCPLVYASSAGLRIEGKNIQKEIKMENAKDALEAYGDYVDSVRKR
jgi:hypothetical protein